MIVAYLVERFAPALFLPLAALIAAAAAGGDYALTTLSLDAFAALLLLAQFRLWDDLADRDTDTLTYPDRVLVTAPTTRPFVWLCVTLAILSMAWTLTRAGVGLSLAVLVLLHSALGFWYWRRTRRTVAGDQLRLAKYPAFVVVLAGTRLADAPLTIGLSAAAIYAGASLYEAWHDPVSPLGALLGGRS